MSGPECACTFCRPSEVHLPAATLIVMRCQALTLTDWHPEVDTQSQGGQPKDRLPDWLVVILLCHNIVDWCDAISCTCRIFSIDPPTARDLDDALSIEALPGGIFRVGVHIADVAYFVPAGSALDEEARERGTSVYLVDRVIPMLPRLLCEQLCSLNPGIPQ